jgi:uncharacterized OB-fold protein
MAQVNHDTAEVWEGWQRHELRIGHCQACGKWINLPKPFCPECWSDDVVTEVVDGAAHLVTFSVPRTFGDEAEPVVTGIVSLDAADDVRMVARIAGCPPDDVVSGMALTLDWREEDGAVFPQFRPATGAGA